MTRKALRQLDAGMRALIIMALFLAQTATPPKPAQPVQPTPRASQPVETTARSALMSVLVTDSTGAPLGDVAVHVTGPVTREGRTAGLGTMRFTNVRAGTYRLRFSKDGFITFEREVTVKAGQPVEVEATLSAAPPSAAAQPCPEPSRAAEPSVAELPAGVIGQPKTVAVPSFVEANFIGRAPRRDSRLGCVGSGTATLVQLREALVEQVDAQSDLWIYVVAGEASLRVNDREESISAGAFSVVPRTMRHSIVPRGRNPLIMISIRTGEACPELGK